MLSLVSMRRFCGACLTMFPPNNLAYLKSGIRDSKITWALSNSMRLTAGQRRDITSSVQWRKTETTWTSVAKFTKQYYQLGPEGHVPKVWADLVVQSVLGMSTDNLASLVLLPTEQLYSLPKRKETRLLLCKNVQRLVKRHRKACEGGESGHELLLNLTVGTVTS